MLTNLEKIAERVAVITNKFQNRSYDMSVSGFRAYNDSLQQLVSFCENNQVVSSLLSMLPNHAYVFPNHPIDQLENAPNNIDAIALVRWSFLK
jgi:hypothetical protein